jgi:hypothetical protein
MDGEVIKPFALSSDYQVGEPISYTLDTKKRADSGDHSLSDYKFRNGSETEIKVCWG